MVAVQCAECDTIFDRYRSQINDNNFCSKSCYQQWQRDRRVIVCDWCGDEYEEFPCNIEEDKKNFCSPDCQGKWHSEEFRGENHPNWKGGEAWPYTSYWDKHRKKALERDDYECQNCGRGEDELGQTPDVHHIKPYREFENPKEAHELSNLVCLCRSCHIEVEKGGNVPWEE